MCTYNTSRSDDERRDCSKYTIGADQFWFAIPPEDDDTMKFASYGPKVNHKFYYDKTKYQMVLHPRFGMVMGVFLKAGFIFEHFL